MNDSIIQTLTVPFAAGFVVQRLVDTYTTAKIADPNRKKFVIGVVSLALCWVLAGVGEIHIFSALNWTKPSYLDVIASGIFISRRLRGLQQPDEVRQLQERTQLCRSREDGAGLGGSASFGQSLGQCARKSLKTFHPQCPRRARSVALVDEGLEKIQETKSREEIL